MTLEQTFDFMVFSPSLGWERKRLYEGELRRLIVSYGFDYNEADILTYEITNHQYPLFLEWNGERAIPVLELDFLWECVYRSDEDGDDSLELGAGLKIMNEFALYKAP